MIKNTIFMLMVLVPLNGCFKGSDQTRFALAAARGDEVLVRELIARGSIDINSTNGDVGPALCLAAYGGHSSLVRFLLDRGADVNVKDRRGSFPLMDAVMGQHRDVVQILLERGADPFMTINGENGEPTDFTALKLATVKGDSETIAMLEASMKKDSP